MQTPFNCAECGTRITVPSARSVKTVTCRRCGEVYFCNDGSEPRKMYPALSMYPVDTAFGPLHDGGVPSRWMPTHTRPVRYGTYECRFRTTEPATLWLHWNGVSFTHAGHRVAMGAFLTWRGVLA